MKKSFRLWFLFHPSAAAAAIHADNATAAMVAIAANAADAADTAAASQRPLRRQFFALLWGSFVNIRLKEFFVWPSIEDDGGQTVMPVLKIDWMETRFTAFLLFLLHLPLSLSVSVCLSLSLIKERCTLEHCSSFQIWV